MLYFILTEMHNFRDELTDVLADTRTLLHVCWSVYPSVCLSVGLSTCVHVLLHRVKQSNSKVTAPRSGWQSIYKESKHLEDISDVTWVCMCYSFRVLPCECNCVSAIVRYIIDDCRNAQRSIQTCDARKAVKTPVRECLKPEQSWC